MEPLQSADAIVRRHFFRECGLGLGTMALASLLQQESLHAAPSQPPLPSPVAPKPGHFPAKAKSVIFLFMAGGPSQFELFDPKPELQKWHGQAIPDSFTKGKRFAFMDTFAKEKPKLLGTKRKFAQYGQTGTWVSECLPHTAKVVDDLTFVHSMATNVFNHGPAKVFLNTGSPQFGRPSMGSWVTYGIGSESQSLPGFVVLQSGPRGPRGGFQNWTSGFLPTTYQGVPFRSGGDPIINLSSPAGMTADRQRQTLDVLRDLNSQRLQATGDAEIQTRIAAYEMAFRMQKSAPDLIDLKQEPRMILDDYGAEPGKASFANNCLLARRLVQRGVRFVQLYHTDWDHHGNGGENLDRGLDKVCLETDRACAALIRDLKRTGLLDSTLVVWGGEFGRTPMGEIRDTVGRNHHIDAYTMWMAGGGIKPGVRLGQTDEFGFSPIADRVHVHDLQATILHLLGLDHTKLTYRFQGRDFRLTDVHGEVVHSLLA
ncbi:DUF1501 domain-containing protein [Tuwongella immobilis]|uniref:Sulfatase n=1 Tax=Tuwongella immobilis TaxID=692036 RepID=A0A6C2YL41_9BACT|nr:DUF1501 domain-containing protein [Tuwongella immobilis]VIP01949.1 sulfatase : Uncharacterized protein OS=Singulisphaera acidiphila (strain ATCC BAA-1392 / DSM 18658 / VKM B-2454 / MOB10) GN=Sinac_5110 PE=4 SV=1: DUF1501 [Tuwongella immobilis]VTR99934.1 sulfatase : Uncharacterized protein OS=Singulisphaera acidiphila (strain ATCC BAA-1392 / DSM 18658 / VKM B-2454 / MOB10) GN=Sinac_5110 PE=4 SV=1: DUF1501 [Tuwongella immobilis]